MTKEETTTLGLIYAPFTYLSTTCTFTLRYHERGNDNFPFSLGIPLPTSRPELLPSHKPVNTRRVQMKSQFLLNPEEALAQMLCVLQYAQAHLMGDKMS